MSAEAQPRPTDATAPGSTPERTPRGRARRAAVFVLALGLVLALLHALLVEVFVVNGTSMDPLLRDEDRVLVLKAGSLEPGELVVFRNPWEPAQNVIKRVVARGGDRVEIRAGVVLVNGRELDEPYLVHPGDRDGSVNFSEQELKPGEVFVLGDNRAASVDSRRFGPIEPSWVVGRAVLALWPLRRL